MSAAKLFASFAHSKTKIEFYKGWAKRDNRETHLGNKLEIKKYCRLVMISCTSSLPIPAQSWSVALVACVQTLRLDGNEAEEYFSPCFQFVLMSARRLCFCQFESFTFDSFSNFFTFIKVIVFSVSFQISSLRNLIDVFRLIKGIFKSMVFQELLFTWEVGYRTVNKTIPITIWIRLLIGSWIIKIGLVYTLSLAVSDV